ncbi:MAG: hypothetical protein HQL53_08180 [Magnetococcales bacterium]|nr:hypothetical protein [Magnetococcales bacterium]
MSVENTPHTPSSGKNGTAVVVVRPAEGRRLIGEAVAALPQVKQRQQNGHMVVVGGSTNRHLIRHLTEGDPGCASFAIGWIRAGQLDETPRETRGEGPFLFEDGKVSRGWPGHLLERFGPGDLYIKGANALDADGHVSVLMGSPVGGTIGAALTILLARGGELIVPVSMQKLIPSVPKSCGLLGQGVVGRVMGSMPVGLMPIMAGTATVITEVEAFKTLFNVRAIQVAAGGLADCAGAMVFHLQGAPDGIESAWERLLEIRQACDDDPEKALEG